MAIAFNCLPEMVKENNCNKHDEQAKSIDSESVFPPEIPDYQRRLIFAYEKVKIYGNLFVNFVESYNLSLE